MKYPMTLKTEKPLFEYLVKDNMNMDYYLFETFDEALKTAQTLSIKGSRHILIYENDFNTTTREWHGRNTFDVIDGKVRYDRYARTELHLAFYVNAGEWLNPNNGWMKQIVNRAYGSNAFKTCMENK